ncbi:MAG: penicillin-binding protein 2 [Coriobacteriia bacterium]|nr:penicillin-binding protein 2 [Coriobacteriia bacterium]
MLGICLAGARFVHLQVIEAERLSAYAEQQRTRRIETPAQRGTIFDRSGRALAQSVRVYTVVVDPHNIASFFDDYVAARELRDEPVEQSLENLHKDLAEYFSEKLGIDEEELLPQFSRRAASGNFSRFSVLAREISPDIRLSVNSDAQVNVDDTPEQRLFRQSLRHTVWELDYMRIYPMGEVAAQVIGFVNAEGYGAAGIELQFEEILRGSPGVSFTERDVAGNIIPAGLQKAIEPSRGSDIMLTIDAEITNVAQQELERAVSDTMAVAASALVMNPRTGEIYAAVSYPGFDANEFNLADQEAIRNRALVDVLEPGSTIKPLTIAAALDAGSIDLDDDFYIPNSIQVGTRVVSDAVERPTEVMSVSRIMEVSSNVGTTRIAQRMGSDTLYDYLHRFAITERPGLDFPGAGSGHVLSPEEWSDVTLSNFSFGQGLSMSPLQISRAMAAIANDGMMTTPHLLQAVPDGSFPLPEHEEIRVISEEAARQTTKTLEAVMIEGTGRNIDVQNYEVAGKTGTAQKAREGVAGYVEGLYISSFIGYLPANDPELLITIFVDEPRTSMFGSEVAGPPFANIATFTARYLGL